MVGYFIQAPWPNHAKLRINQNGRQDMNSLSRYMMALVFLIAFVMGGAVVSSVRQVQATPEAIPQVIIGEVTSTLSLRRWV